MAGHKYVTKSYSNYNDFPAQEGGYPLMPEHAKWYVVETTVESVRVPASRFTKFGGTPLKNEFFEEHKLKYPSKDHHEDYEPLYRSDYENLSPPPHHERENLMANFLDKVQIRAKQPANTNDLSSNNKYFPTPPNKYRPISPNKNHPTSSNKNRPTSPNKYLNTDSSKYHPAIQEKYRPASPDKDHSANPDKYRLSSPNTYRSTSPENYPPSSPNTYHTINSKKYPPTSPNKYLDTSPKRYLPTSPSKYRATSPKKYLPSSPNKFYHTNPINYRLASPNKYHTKSPNKHQPVSINYPPKSPEKYQPTSLVKQQPTNLSHSSPSKESHITKTQTLPDPNKYQYISPTNNRLASPIQNYPSKEEHTNRPQDLQGQNKYHPLSSFHILPPNELQPIRTQILSDPNKNYSSSHGAEVGRHSRVIDFSNPNYDWQSGGSPITRHPLTKPTNNINEAIGFLMESVNYSQFSDRNREGAFKNSSPRAQPFEHEKRYTRPTFGGVTNRPYLRSNMIDSEEAVRRYNGAYVP